MRRTINPAIKQPTNKTVINIDVEIDEKGNIICPVIKFNFIKQTPLFNNAYTGGRAYARKPKEKNNKKENSFNILLNSFDDKWKDSEEFKKSLQDFLINRKQKGKTLTPLACKRLANHLSKYKLPIVIQAINKSVRNNWTGIFPESETNNKTKNKPSYKEWEGRRYYLCPDGEYRNKAGSLFIE